jgi:hypothetical protein
LNKRIFVTISFNIKGRAARQVLSGLLLLLGVVSNAQTVSVVEESSGRPIAGVAIFNADKESMSLLTIMELRIYQIL